MTGTIHQKLQDSEESYLNTTFWEIQPLFLFVQNGDTEQLETRLDIQLERFPAGRISRDARKQMEYLTVSLVNTFMIAAIEGGVYPPDANAIADKALRSLSRIRSVSEIPELISEAAIQLCDMVRETKRKDSGNIHVEKAKNYLSAHLTQEIRMEQVANAVGISLFHLSHIFKSCTGYTMREYLTQERINAAKQLLTENEKTIPQIAFLLRFCDQSYFTKVFRGKTGMTPVQYRNRFIF